MYKLISFFTEKTFYEIQVFDELLGSLLETQNDQFDLDHVSQRTQQISDIQKLYPVLERTFSGRQSWPSSIISGIDHINVACGFESSSVKELMSNFLCIMRLGTYCAQVHKGREKNDIYKEIRGVKSIQDEMEILGFEFSEIAHINQYLFSEDIFRSPRSKITSLDFFQGYLVGLRVKADHQEAKVKQDMMSCSEKSIKNVMTSLLTGQTDLLSFSLMKSPLYINSDWCSPYDALLIDTLYRSVEPEGQEESLPGKWVTVVGRLLGLVVNSNALNMMIPKGRVGLEFDMALSTLDSALIKDAFKSFIKEIRTKASVTENDEQFRWKVAESRVGESLDLLIEHPSFTRKQELDLYCTITDWKNKFSNTCSVGVDLQVIRFLSEVKDILNPELHDNRALTPQIEWSQGIQSTVIQHIQSSLQSISLPFDFSQDVHHVNLALALIYQLEGKPIPDTIKDPFIVAMGDEIRENRAQIVDRFRDPSWILQLVSNHLLDPIEGSVSVKSGLDHLGDVFFHAHNRESMLNDFRRNMISLCMNSLDDGDARTFFQSLEARLVEIDETIGGHWILGMAALQGRKVVFDQLRTTLGVEHALRPDAYNFTLVDYVIGGGNTDLFTDLKQCFLADDLRTSFARAFDTKGSPNPVSLAIESESIPMFNMVLDIIDEGSLEAYLELKDVFRRTPLEVALSLSNHSQIVDMLLSLGATYNIEIDGVFFEHYLLFQEDFPTIKVVLFHDFVDTGLKSFLLNSMISTAPDVLEKFFETLSPEEGARLLLMDCDGFNVAHELAQNQGSFLSSLCSSFLRDYAVDILVKQNYERRSVSFSLAQHFPNELIQVVSQLAEEEKLKVMFFGEFNDSFMTRRQAIQAATDREVFGWELLADDADKKTNVAFAVLSILESLDKDNQLPLIDILPNEIIVDLFELDVRKESERTLQTGAETETMAHKFVSYENDIVYFALQQKIPDKMRSILTLRDSYCSTVAHQYARCRPCSLVQMLDALPPNFILEISHHRNQDGDTVMHTLAREHRTVFLDFSERLPSEMMTIILDWRNHQDECVGDIIQNM